MTVDIAARRQEAADHLETLKREGAEAILAGKSPDPAAVMAAQATLDAIDAAEGEQTRQSRDARQAAYEAQQAECRAELQSALDDRQAAVARAEKAARAFVSALAKERETRSTITVALAGLQITNPISLDRGEVAARLSARMVALLRTTIDPPGRFGCLTIGPCRDHDPASSWTDAEATEVNEVVNQLLKETTS